MCIIIVRNFPPFVRPNVILDGQTNRWSKHHINIPIVALTDEKGGSAGGTVGGHGEPLEEHKGQQVAEDAQQEQDLRDELHQHVAVVLEVPGHTQTHAGS